MSASILDGRAAADRILKKLQNSIARTRHPITLVAIIVGNRFDSRLYVRLKRRAAAQVGINTEIVQLPNTTTQAALERCIHRLNKRAKVHGILLQLPLPRTLNTDAAVAAIAPEKDVDGFRSDNTFVVPPPIGAVIRLIRLAHPKPSSVAVILAQPSVFTVRLSRALEEQGYCATHVEPHGAWAEATRRADIVITALGSGPRLRRTDIKRGASIIDVGIRKQGKKTVGDVHPSAWRVASAISPVPGGVGPLTIACVLENTYHLAIRK